METGVFERKGSVFFPVGGLDVPDNAHQQLRALLQEDFKPEKTEKKAQQERNIPTLSTPRYRGNTETQYADTEVSTHVFMQHR